MHESVPPVRVRRVVTTRAGGRSAAPYDSFNLGDDVGDDPRPSPPTGAASARARLGPERVAWMNQVHGTDVAVVDVGRTRTDPDGRTRSSPTGRASRSPCSPPTACRCCSPTPTAGVVGAAHAGRRRGGRGVLPRHARGDDGARRRARRASRSCSGRRSAAPATRCPAAMRDEVEAALPGSACRTRVGTPGLDLRAGLRRQLAELGRRPASAPTRAAPSRTTSSSATAAAHAGGPRAGSPR